MGMLASLMVTVGTALAAVDGNSPVVLDFEQVSPVYPFASNNIAALDYYNGGLSSAGTGGPDYGVEIGSNGLVICLNTLEVVCELSNTSRGGAGAGSDQGALFFLSGSETYINVARGFDTGFSFNYVSVAVAGEARIYDGLNGSGTLLGSIALAPNSSECPGYNVPYCAFSPIGVSFAGVAKSVFFAGVANQIVFDDITFGSVTPGVVPEPTTALLMLGGMFFVGSIFRARRQNLVRASGK
ncbi:MAG: PEP-CTERM sorting domain-containing protein [Chitinophagaceae bacterium]|nr:PEP-CTERM sorting domain-containing protein [Rubrivivax sp.]